MRMPTPCHVWTIIPLARQISTLLCHRRRGEECEGLAVIMCIIVMLLSCVIMLLSFGDILLCSFRHYVVYDILSCVIVLH